MAGPNQQSLPNFQSIVDPAYLQDQEAGLFQSLSSRQSSIGDFGGGGAGITSGGGGYGGLDPSGGLAFDPTTFLTSLFA